MEIPQLKSLQRLSPEYTVPPVEAAATEAPPSPPAPGILQCDICGATSTPKGPFKSEKSVKYHKLMLHEGMGKKAAAVKKRNRMLREQELQERGHKLHKRMGRPPNSERNISVRVNPMQMRRVRFCTVCGTNIELIERALEIGEMQRQGGRNNG